MEKIASIINRILNLKFLKVALLLFLSLSLVFVLAGCADKQDKTLKEGIYTETVDGYHGKIEVTTKVDKDGKIVDVIIGDHSETDGVGTVEKLPELIIEKQSLDVDGVSGASITMAGILNSVATSIEKAGGDLLDFGWSKENIGLAEDYPLPSIDSNKMPEKAEKSSSVIITDAKGREVEIPLPLSTYAVRKTMDVFEYIIPLC